MSYSLMTGAYHLPRMREMGRIYWCNTFAMFGSSLVAIFVPIFLMRNGYSFTIVLGFLLLQQVLSAVLQYPASRLFQHVHPHHILGGGTVVYAGFFILLTTLPATHWPLWLVALVWALNRATYWAAFHYIFGLARRHKVAGMQIAGFEALTIFAATLGPAIGGVIATLFGIHYSYVFTVAILIVAALPLLATSEEPPRAKLQISWREVWAMWRDAAANASNGVILVAELSLWPLLVYVFVSSYAGVGLLSSLIAISAVLITLLVGKSQNTYGRHYLNSGLGAYSLTSLGRAVVQSGTQVVGLNLLAGIGRSLYVTPYMNHYYDNSDGAHRLGYITVMEIAFAIGSAAIIGVLLLLSLAHDMRTVLSVGLALAAILGPGVRLMR